MILKRDLPKYNPNTLIIIKNILLRIKNYHKEKRFIIAGKMEQVEN
jgi:hypothetical protein